MSKLVKVFYKTDIRRFELKNLNGVTFREFKSTVLKLFTCQTQNEDGVKLRWKDSDGDLILFSSDEELRHAISQNVSGTFLVFMDQSGSLDLMRQLQNSESVDSMVCISQSKPTRSPGVHGGIRCDGYGCPVNNISGIRFKCKVCDDFDLCKICMSKGKHSQHEFWKIQFLVSDAGQTNTLDACREPPPPYE